LGFGFGVGFLIFGKLGKIGVGHFTSDYATLIEGHDILFRPNNLISVM